MFLLQNGYPLPCPPLPGPEGRSRQQRSSAGLYGSLSAAVLAQASVPPLQPPMGGQGGGQAAGTLAVAAAFTKRFVEGTLDPSLGDAATIARGKLKHKVILLDNPGPGAASATKKSDGEQVNGNGPGTAKRAPNTRRGPRMTSRRARSTGMFAIPTENQRWAAKRSPVGRAGGSRADMIER